MTASRQKVHEIMIRNMNAMNLSVQNLASHWFFMAMSEGLWRKCTVRSVCTSRIVRRDTFGLEANPSMCGEKQFYVLKVGRKNVPHSSLSCHTILHLPVNECREFIMLEIVNWVMISSSDVTGPTRYIVHVLLKNLFKTIRCHDLKLNVVSFTTSWKRIPLHRK